MKKLNAKDLAILRARGINSLTTLRGKEAEFKVPAKPKKPVKPNPKPNILWLVSCSIVLGVTI